MWMTTCIGSHPEDRCAESGWGYTYFDQSLLITALSKQIAMKQTIYTSILEDVADWFQSRQIGDYIPVDEKDHILISCMTLNS